MTQAHPWRYFWTVIIARAFSACWTVAGTVVQQPLAQFFNSHWHEYSTVACKIFSTVTGTIIQQSLARLFNSHWHDCSIATDTIVQQSLARLFKSRRHDCSTVTDTIMQQWLARVFNSHWHGCSTVIGTIVQKSLARFYAGRILQQCWRIVPCTRNATQDPLDIFNFKLALGK